ncbi:MAG: hypothetical protein GXO63_01495 [Candidatus Micrarchaeota archaeon]|nr:hypothetical protein [Candidatus Micrarchaeota archaeon]
MARSNFPFVLVIGILLLAAAFVFFNMPGEEGRVKHVVYREPGTEEPKTVFSPTGEVKHIKLAEKFEIGSTEKKILLSAGNLTVKNGFFASKDEKFFFKADPENMNTSLLEIEVIDTNLYGALIFRLNGKDVLSRNLAKGRYVFNVNSSEMGKENTLEIKAGHSGWRIWAPTMYIFNFNLSGVYPSKEKVFFVNVTNIKNINGARLAFSVSGSGNLTVSVNGEDVFGGEPGRYRIIDFDPSLLKDNNTISFSTDGKYTVLNPELIIFYTPPSKPAVYWYYLSEEDYDKLRFRNASMRFTIEKISGDVRSVSIKVMSSGKTHVILIQGIIREGGRYSVTLTRNELSPGNNTIVIVAEGGSVRIKDVSFIPKSSR